MTNIERFLRGGKMCAKENEEEALRKLTNESEGEEAMKLANKTQLVN